MRRRRPEPLPACLALAACLAFPAACGEAGAEAPDPERVRALAARLGDEAHAAREAATRELLALGPAAWPLLEPLLKDARDPECAVRLRLIAREAGILLEEQKPFVAAQLTALVGPGNQGNAQACDALLDLGPPGEHALREYLEAAEAEPYLSFKTEPPATLRAGEQAEVQIELKNRSRQPVWISALSQSWRLSPVKHTSLGGARPTAVRVGSGGGRRTMRSSGRRGGHPLLQHLGIREGGAHTFNARLSGGATGFTEYAVSFLLSDMALEIPRADGRAPARLTLNAGLSQELGAPSIGCTILCLPNLETVEDDPRLALTLERAEDAPPRAGEKLALRARFKSKATLVTQRLERNLIHYAWWVLLDANGGHVAHGAWDAALEAGEAARAARDLPPEGEAAWPLAIQLPKEPGAYRLLAGYEIDADMVSQEAAPEYDLPGEKDERFEFRLRRAKLYAELEEVEVAAP
ncbi:MAG: hypothetical protein M5U26_05370 [Planctomycetota bacterium]|nr:hypothetical protein [Planctomycetota bacterium]